MEKLIVAHRGASSGARENTTEAFLKAIEAGADIIELDVRLTRDNVLAVFHDEAIEGKKIRNLSFQELNNIAKNKNFIAPTLNESLTLIAGKIFVQIELKDPDCEKQAAEIALKTLKPAEFSIISFYFTFLKKIKTHYPSIKTGLILGSRLKRLPLLLHFLLQRESRLKFLDFASISSELWQWGFAKLLPGGLPIFVWTVDSPDLAARLFLEPRISGFATNLPGEMVNLRKRFYQPPPNTTGLPVDEGGSS